MATRSGSNVRLTPRQMQILRFVRDFSARKGYAPSMQELADELGVSKVTVFEHLEHLAEKRLIRRRRHAARSIELTNRVDFPDQRGGQLPLVGSIAAGSPIEAVEDHAVIELDEFFAGSGGDRFVLQVRGDSMIDEHIRDGDYVVVEPRSTIRNGQTVVALLPDGEATLKTYYRQGRRIRLQPANPRYEPIFLAPGEVQIQGVVVGVMRRY